MAILLDSGFYLGLIHKKDAYYAQAQEWILKIRSGSFGQIYTTNYVMAETATLVAARTDGHPLAIQRVRDLFSGHLQIATFIHISEEEEISAWDLFQKLASSADILLEEGIISFVDCITIVACQSRDIGYIASFDGHFRPWLSYP